MAKEKEMELAIKVIKRLWPTVKVNENNVTPDVAAYVLVVYARAKEGDKFVKALFPFLSLPTTWKSIPMKLIKAIRGYMKGGEKWGLAIRGAVAAHRRNIAMAMMYGTKIYPIKFR